ncbi:hypothetical protein EV189_2498 [Motilibacter rhizosphaerae]|uniref:Uncharacterized protein n=1 Tax=Motilibacter rhizosphaerae TaxID=598652 RepID=A0A4Q7NQ14_9ACTN|nr:hypothetical protein EV189_2498 [Motilibacter rhizosphaerae]
MPLLAVLASCSAGDGTPTGAPTALALHAGAPTGSPTPRPGTFTSAEPTPSTPSGPTTRGAKALLAKTLATFASGKACRVKGRTIVQGGHEVRIASLASTRDYDGTAWFDDSKIRIRRIGRTVWVRAEPAVLAQVVGIPLARAKAISGERYVTLPSTSPVLPAWLDLLDPARGLGVSGDPTVTPGKTYDGFPVVTLTGSKVGASLLVSAAGHPVVKGVIVPGANDPITVIGCGIALDKLMPPPKGLIIKR